MEKIFFAFKKYSSHKVLLMIWAIFYLFAQIILFYPGQFFIDSNSSWSQFNLGEYNNWHPPILTVWWHLLHFKGAIFLVHICVIVLSLTVISIRLLARNKISRTYVIICYFSLPLLFRLFSWVLKDIGMIAGLLFAVMLIIQIEQSTNKKIKYLLTSLLILALYYSFNIRANGVFAVFPILIYVFFYVIRTMVFVNKLLLLLLSVISFVAINNYVTVKVFNARDLIPQSYMLLTDLARLECSEKIAYKIPPLFFRNEIADHKQLCDQVNSPELNEDLMFDTLLRNDFIESNGTQLVMTEDKYVILKHEWRQEILHNFFLYAEERVKFFVKVFISTRFTLDAKHPQFTLYPQIVFLYTLVNVLINYIILIVGILIPSYCITKNKYPLSFFVSLSGWLYLLGWVPLVALGETRYFIWFFIAQIISYSIMPLNCVEYILNKKTNKILL